MVFSPVKNSEPDRILRVDEAGLKSGRYFRQRRSALSAVYHKRDELAIADKRQDKSDRCEEEVDPSGHYFGRRLRTTPERNVHRLYSGAGGESFGAQMGGGADADRGESQGARVCLGRCDEVCDFLEALCRRDDQDVRRNAEGNNRRKSRAGS